jgi:DNA-binding NarL/FixJ family response regulator
VTTEIREGGARDQVRTPPLVDSRRTIRVALVDDHHLVREGLRLVLTREPGIEVVDEAGDAAEAIDLIERSHPDVVLLDLSLGDLDGVQLIRSMLVRQASLRVLILTMHRDAETVRQALLAGAAGYMVKGARSAELVEAIRAVVRGERYLHSAITAAIVDDSMRWLQAGGPLSAREREILILVAAGHSAPDVGRILGISPHTVRRHVANLSAKLKVRGIAGLARYATTHGLVRDEV